MWRSIDKLLLLHPGVGTPTKGRMTKGRMTEGRMTKGRKFIR